MDTSGWLATPFRRTELASPWGRETGFGNFGQTLTSFNQQMSSMQREMDRMFEDFNRMTPAVSCR